MAFKKAPTWFLNVMILTFAVSLPFLHSSTTSPPLGTNMAENRPLVTSNKEVPTFGNEASVGTVEESARKVPTGPDPLHHNKNPIGP